jgi:hypothetical protein
MQVEPISSSALPANPLPERFRSILGILDEVILDKATHDGGMPARALAFGSVESSIHRNETPCFELTEELLDAAVLHLALKRLV